MEAARRRPLTAEHLIFYLLCALFFLIPVATSPAVVAGISAISVWVFSGRFVKDRRWLRQRWTLPVIAFMLLPWAGLLYSPDPSSGLGFAKKSYYWLYAFAIAGISLGGRAPAAFVKSYLAGLTLSLAISMLQYAGLFPMPKGFHTAFIGGASPYIMYSLLIVLGMLMLSFYFGRAEGAGPKALTGFLMAACFLNLAIIPGRIGYLAFALLSPVIFYNLLGRKHLMVVAGTAVVAVALMLSSPLVQKRIGLAAKEVRMYYAGKKNTSVGLRLYMYDGAARIFLENPVLGAGTGGYGEEMKRYKVSPDTPDIDQPHNSFLFVAASYGIVGLALFLWVFVELMRKGWLGRAEAPGFFVLSFGCVLFVGGLTDTQFLSLATGVLFALLMGMETGAG